MSQEVGTEEIGIVVEDDTMIIRAGGELDHHNAVELRTLVDRELIKGKIKNVIFDFTDTNFMDSSGIGTIIGRQKIMESIGGSVRVRNMNPNISRIFQISGLHKIIKVQE